MESQIAIIRSYATKGDLADMADRFTMKVFSEGKNYVPPGVTFDGFAEDPREAWNIPEVKELVIDMANVGFMSVVAVDGDAGLKTLGSMELWGILTGEMKDGKMELSSELMDEFQEFLCMQNEICESRIEFDATAEG